MLLRNVLIFHSAALGDFVLNWPLALGLGRLWPQSRIFYVTQPQKGRLAERLLRIESIDADGHGWHTLHSDGAGLSARAQSLLAGAHAIFNFSAGDDGCWRENVRRLAPAAMLLDLNANPNTASMLHVSEHLVKQLHEHYAIAEAFRQMLRSLGARGLDSRLSGDGAIAIHPGAGAASKCWPADAYVALARLLIDSGLSVKFLIGEVEQERWTPAQVAAFRDIAEVRSPADYIELYEALSDASAFVGNDSGPAHLAGIVGLPTFAIFGPTSPDVWRPLGPRTHVLRRQLLGNLDVQEVAQWILAGLRTSGLPRPAGVVVQA